MCCKICTCNIFSFNIVDDIRLAVDSSPFVVVKVCFKNIFDAEVVFNIFSKCFLCFHEIVKLVHIIGGSVKFDLFYLICEDDVCVRFFA